MKKLGLFLVLLWFSELVNAEQDCDSITREGLIKCAESSFSKSDRILNEQYNTLMFEISPDKKSELKSVQRAWISFKDDFCNDVYNSIYPGQEAPIDKLLCLTRLTSSRLNELIYLRTGFVGDGFYRMISLVKNKTKHSSSDLVETASEMVSAIEFGNNWKKYAEKNCDMVVALHREDPRLCLLRMKFQTL